MGRVFVKNQDGTPLSPCHPARARILLKQGKARVYSVLPFTIQLTYRIEEDKGAPLRVGIDDGAQEVGWAGTDRAENLITLCQPCHEAVHHGTTVINNYLIMKRRELQLCKTPSRYLPNPGSVRSRNWLPKWFPWE
ncbi:MAG TPA: hypothetical protein GXX29_03260 [Firmicutes bacterium]|nr:hypothetical protein [Bacillota bacterium]